MVVVAHSPTPSTVRMAASSYGEGKNALAACDSWCSVKRTGALNPGPIPLRITPAMFAFSLSHVGMPAQNDWSPRGALAR